MGKPLRWMIGFAIAAIFCSIIAFRFVGTSVTVQSQIVLQGNVDVRQVNLSFKVGGRIAELMADEGDHVEAGQTIATLDPMYFKEDLQLAQAQLDQARANLDRMKNGSRPEEIEQAEAQEAKAKATLERAQQDLTRSQTLIETKAISTQEFDASRAAFLEAQAAFHATQAVCRLTKLGPRSEDIAASQSQFDAAAAQVLISKRRVEDANLVVPNDGVILTRAREVGAIVNAGEVLFTLTLVNPVWVRTYVNETDLGNIQPGMKVIVETDTRDTNAISGDSSQIPLKNRRYEGHVGFISPTAEFTPKAVETRELRTNLVYRLRIVVDDPNGSLKQGMPVTIAIDLNGSRTRTFYERMLEALGLAPV